MAAIGSIPFGIPAEYADALKAGTVRRFGTILKDVATGQIVAHVQETGLLSRGFSLLSNLPLGPVEAASGIVANVQLYGIDRKLNVVTSLLEGLRTLQIANLALGAVGLGVSIGGFLYVRKRLQTMGETLDSVSARMDRIATTVDRLEAAGREKEIERLIAALKRLDDAKQRQKGRDEIIRSVEGTAAEVSESLPRLINATVDHGAPLAELARLIEFYALALAMLVQCPMLLGEAQSALSMAVRVANDANRVLDPLSPLRLMQATRAGPHDEETCRAFIAAVREVQALIGSRPHLAATLAAQSVDTREFMDLLQDEQQAPLVLIPHRV